MLLINGETRGSEKLSFGMKFKTSWALNGCLISASEFPNRLTFPSTSVINR